MAKAKRITKDEVMNVCKVLREIEPKNMYTMAETLEEVSKEIINVKKMGYSSIEIAHILIDNTAINGTINTLVPQINKVIKQYKNKDKNEVKNKVKTQVKDEEKTQEETQVKDDVFNNNIDDEDL